MEKYVIKSETEMKELARKLGRCANGGSIYSLIGEMGAGKTVFAKGFCEGLECYQLVSSPTYSIMNEYDGKFKIYHYDFYRIIDENEAEELGLMEHFGDFDAVCLIEWACNVKSYIPKSVIKIKIEKLSETTREVTLYDRDSH